MEISSYEGSTRLDNTPFALTIGTTYNVIIRLEQSGDFDRTYKMKVWEQGTPEPSGWTVSATEQLDEPYTGSFLMNAHYHGITFGDVTITEIPGGDIIRGTEGNDTLIATNAGAANPGRGEIDVMIGEAGADVFVFGQNGKVFYDDDNSGSDGRSDYALVWDFDASVDTVFLAGSSSDYFLSSTPSGVENGTGIYYDNGVGELIGVLAGVTGLNLNSDVFDFENGSIA